MVDTALSANPILVHRTITRSAPVTLAIHQVKFSFQLDFVEDAQQILTQIQTENNALEERQFAEAKRDSQMIKEVASHVHSTPEHKIKTPSVCLILAIQTRLWPLRVLVQSVQQDRSHTLPEDHALTRSAVVQEKDSLEILVSHVQHGLELRMETPTVLLMHVQETKKWTMKVFAVTAQLTQLFLQTEELALLLHVQEEKFLSQPVSVDNVSLTQNPTPVEEIVLLIPVVLIPKAHQLETARHAPSVGKLLLMEDSA